MKRARSTIPRAWGRLILGLALWVCLVGCGDEPTADTRMTDGGPNGPLRLLDLEGGQVDPFGGSDAEATVFLFVRSDCPISNRYAPVVRQLIARFGSRGVDFHLVYVDPDESPEIIGAHMREYNYPGGALRDPEHRLVELTGASRTPEAAVFGPEHKLVYRGRIDDRYVDFGTARPAPSQHDLADALVAVLAGEPVALRTTEAVGCYISDLR